MSISIPATFRAYAFDQIGNATQHVTLRSDVAQEPLEPTQLRVKVASAGLNPIDWKLAEGIVPLLAHPPTPENPCRIGFDFVGTVVEVGKSVVDFQLGDEVYAMPTFAGIGSFAEYFTVPADLVARKPSNLNSDQAAGIPLAGLTSYQALVEHGQLKAGQTVLILGGSGGTGSLAIQIAKAVGATVITTTSFRNADWVKKLGADRVIDYTKENWGQVIAPHSLDLIYDCGMEPESWNADAQNVLKPTTGRFVTIEPIPDQIESPIGATAVHFFTRMSGIDMSKLTALAEEGKLVPTIGSVHPFEQLSEALAAQKSGRAKGKVVLQVAVP